jgi:hypothetical protein
MPLNLVAQTGRYSLVHISGLGVLQAVPTLALDKPCDLISGPEQASNINNKGVIIVNFINDILDSCSAFSRGNNYM